MNIRTNCSQAEIVKAQKILPYAKFVGMASDSRLNNGQELPLFESVEPKDRPSINSLEGWSAAADATNRRAFVSANGREPENRDELYTWVYLMCEKAEAAV